MKKNTFLSVLIPVYNGADTLRVALQSVAVQGNGIEIVLVDQGSTDRSVSIAKEFLTKLDLKIISHPESSGWVENTNLALDNASAPFATLLHQDDFWYLGRRDFVENQLRFFPEATLWVHGADFVNLKGKRIGKFAPPFGRRKQLIRVNDTLQTLLVQNTIALPSVVFRTDDARAIGGLDTSLPMTADWDLWLALARRGPLCWSPDRLVAFRLHNSSQTNSITGRQEYYADQLDQPVKRHLQALPIELRSKVAVRAAASKAANLWLAARFHGETYSSKLLIRQLAAVGLGGVFPFLRQSQLISRIAPRLELLLTRKIEK